ncbi:MAG: protein of unknown function DUF485, partial [uncultured Blastococcus sp.]
DGSRRTTVVDPRGIPGRAELPRVRGPEEAVPRLRVPHDVRVLRLVPALRPALDLRAGLHGDRGLRQREPRHPAGPGAVRDHLRHHPPLREPRQQAHRPDRRRDARAPRAARLPRRHGHHRNRHPGGHSCL